MAQILAFVAMLIWLVFFLFFGPQDFFPELFKNAQETTNIHTKNISEQFWKITKQAQDTVNTTTQKIDETKKVIDTKVEQVQKVKQTVDELGKNIDDLKKIN